MLGFDKRVAMCAAMVRATRCVVAAGAAWLTFAVPANAQQSNPPTVTQEEAAGTAEACAPAGPNVRIKRFDRHWVDDKGYRVIRGVTRAECEQLCLAECSCAMMEYYFGREDTGQKCSFYRHTRKVRGATDAHVGVKVGR